MASIAEKLKGDTAAVPKNIMETDHDNINLSRDQFVLKYRKKAEIERKLELEKQRLEELAAQEEADLIKAGQEDNAPDSEEKASKESEIEKLKAEIEALRKAQQQDRAQEMSNTQESIGDSDSQKNESQNHSESQSQEEV